LRITGAYLLAVFVFSIIIFLLGGLLRFLKNIKNGVQNGLNQERQRYEGIDFKGKAFSKYVFYTGIVTFFLFLSDSCEIL